MKTLLIVEDEKHIRQGLATIASRAPIEIVNIITCANGEEALEVLERENVDALLTDIRMPKMDGITLIKRMQKCKKIPLSVVISGYDDFSYAVEALRCGAKDYILKPIEREILIDILVKLNDEIEQKESSIESTNTASLHAFRYIMLDKDIPKEDFDKLIKQYSDSFVEGKYYVVCGGADSDCPPSSAKIFNIQDKDNQNVFIAPEAEINFVLEKLENRHIGISGAHIRLDELNEAYNEARSARIQAFFTMKNLVRFSDVHKSEMGFTEPFERDIEKIVQLLGVPKTDEAKKLLRSLFAQTVAGEIDGEYMGSLMRVMAERIFEAYQNVAPIGNELKRFENVWAIDNVDEYTEQFTEWITKFSARVETEFEDHRNKQKIQRAIEYMRENYNNAINMAIVSNYVSMNYSLFSLLFKQNTGMNFVNYLQNLRVEESKKLLISTDYRVGEISRKTGFQDERHFMKVFKNIVGVSPSEFRKNSMLGGKRD